MRQFAVVQFVLCAVVVFGQHWWCQFIHFLDLNFCWILSVGPLELKRGFPNHPELVYSLNLVLDYGLLSVSLILVVWANWRALRKNFWLILVSTLFSLAFGEVALRVVGWKPGQFVYNQWVFPVDSVYEVPGFVNNESGILVCDTSFLRTVLESTEGVKVEDLECPNKYCYTKEIVGVLFDHGLIGNVDSVDNEFSERRRRIDSDGADPGNRFDSLFKSYTVAPFNQEGFQSISMDSTGSEGKGVLLLGDSFTWGHSVHNATSSFANTLLARGYWIYNTGISATDVAQYEAILRKYGPNLKPRVVVLNFFMGNDVSYFSREVSKDVPVVYHTNAGVLLSDQFGVTFGSAQEAYDNIMRNMVIPQTSRINRLCSKMAVTTLAWSALANQGIIEHDFFVGERFPDFPITDMEIKRVAGLCDSLDAEFILSVIPKLEDGQVIGAESIPGLFGDVPYHQPHVTASMYKASDGHFNEEGHLFYANYLEKLIRASLDSIHAEQ